MTFRNLPESVPVGSTKKRGLAQVTIEPLSLRAELIELLPGGAKLGVTSCISLAESLRLRIEVADLDLELDIPAGVCWARQDLTGKWVLGCTFDPQLPEDAVKQLAAGKHLEQRRDLRHPISLEAAAYWELVPEKILVELKDYSTGGFSMLCQQPGQAGRRMLLVLQRCGGHEAIVWANVHWRLKSKEQYLLGCTFLNRQGYPCLKKFIGTANEIFYQEDSGPSETI